MSQLNSLLDASLKYDAEYDGGLSNHLPMALVALDRIGSQPADLERFMALYEQRLAQLGPVGAPISDEDWLVHRGEIARYPAFLDFFTQRVASRGQDEVLASYLPALWDGVTAGAFHALIRLASALDAGHDGEVAAGLAYWASRWQPLGEPAAGQGHESEPESVLRAIGCDPALAVPCDGDLIFDRMRVAAQRPGFPGAVAALKIGDDTLARLARCALAVYASTRDFTTLHMVTATHALRVVLTRVGPQEAALPAFWQAVCAAYVSIGAPSFEIASESAHSHDDWEPILARAVTSTNDHIIKLVFTCLEECRFYGDPAYQAIARSLVQPAR